MDITFQKAKNGETTALIGNLYLHSAYNPQREAERFVDNLQNPFCPKIVIITEPGIAYVKNYLRKKFPESKIGIIRYIRGFEEYNKGFDFVINYFENSNNFDNFLLQFFGEEALLETFFCKWDVSSKIFPEIDIKVWHSIKNALENAKTLLITRQYFEKKWLTNTFNFLRYLKNPLLLKNNINFPLLIIASGSSLRAFLPIIKQNQSKFFIIVLSSAIKVCIDNGIKADLALSTDGGYWAGQHLKSLYKNTLVLGGSPESFIPKKILNKTPILPLLYSDGLSKEICNLCNLPGNKAERNGTISGTALDFGLSFFTNDIFICGLDLANCKGFQHTQINELELNSLIKDDRVSSKEKRAVKSQFSKSSLEIYKNWFKNKEIGHRKVYRLIEDTESQNKLGMIKDLNSSSFISFCDNLNSISKENMFIKSNFTYNKEVLIHYLNGEFQSEKCKRQLYPLEFVLLSHNQHNNDVKERIENNHKKLYKKLWGILND